MPNWNEILEELNESKRVDALDYVRRKYLQLAHEKSGRNVITYYSSFLQKPGIEQGFIDDNDKNGFMTVINKMHRDKGLDLILHTPGGDIAAAESIVEYLVEMFDGDIRAIVPQIAMSAGTMIACACKEIVMGLHSSLGPIDPQFGGIPASGIIDEFNRALVEIKENPESILLWREIISKYHPTFIGECEKAISWANEMVTKFLENNMLASDELPHDTAKRIVEHLSKPETVKSHSRHIGVAECESIGLKIIRLENIMRDVDYQDTILSVHHAYMHTFSNSSSVKIIENHEGVALIQHYQAM